MTPRRSVAAQGVLFIASLVLSLVVGARMPDQVVTHWGLNGQPDGWGSKWITMLIMPGVLLLMLGLTILLPRLSPKGFRLENSGPTYGWLMFLVAGLMAILHAVILFKTAGAAFDIGRVILAAMFGAWILMGNVIGRVQPNYYMGIRTPWTLSSQSVWQATHRSAGRLWVTGGLVGLFAALLGLPPTLLIAFFFVICLAPVVQSYFIYRRLEP
ncbi:SdpI family protein [soil metagenome]